MPIRPPALDDRSYIDLVSELLARIPAHTPEWRYPQVGDPGRTLIELFAWLGDTLLYRVNLIPEKQRLAFLRLLGQSLRPAQPAHTVVSLQLDAAEPADLTAPLSLRPRARFAGSPAFETCDELTLYPVQGCVYYKRELSEAEQVPRSQLLEQLRQVYRVEHMPRYYVSTPLFIEGKAIAEGFDVGRQSLDYSLWVALLAPPALAQPAQLRALRQMLRSTGDAPRLLSIGIAPCLDEGTPQLDAPTAGPMPLQFELTVDAPGQTAALEVVEDSTHGLRRAGVVRVRLPTAMPTAPSNDLRTNLLAGLGESPPRIDDPKIAGRLLTWLRLRLASEVTPARFSWIGLHAVRVEQARTLRGCILGQSDGSPNQVLTLPVSSVTELKLEVEEEGRGFLPWQRIEDLAEAGCDDRMYELDREAGRIRFGDGLRGRIPQVGARLHAAELSASGGLSGNVPAETLRSVDSAADATGQPVTRKIKVVQPLPGFGGQDAETLAECERRIPAMLRHRDRAVTTEDYRQLARHTPGVQLGRVEVLERFKPQQYEWGIPGVVTVMALPQRSGFLPPNPRPDRATLDTVHAYLDCRRPLATELYAIGCEYVPLSVSIAIDVRAGFGTDEVFSAVREAVRRYLWPLPPGGPDGQGWPLGRAVSDHELAVVAARVAGVGGLAQVLLFESTTGPTQPPQWSPLVGKAAMAVQLQLKGWQLPELLHIVVSTGTPAAITATEQTFAPGVAIPVPIVPEVC